MIRARAGVGLLRQQVAVAIEQLVLVAFAQADMGEEELPYAAFAAQAHRVAAPVPGVEVADDADAMVPRSPRRRTTARRT